MLWPMRPIFLIHALTDGGVKLGLHDDSALLPVQLAKVLFGRAAAVVAGGVDFGVAVSSEDVEEAPGFFEVAEACVSVSQRVGDGDVRYSGLLGAIANSHGAENDRDVGIWLGRHFCRYD